MHRCILPWSGWTRGVAHPEARSTYIHTFEVGVDASPLFEGWEDDVKGFARRTMYAETQRAVYTLYATSPRGYEGVVVVVVIGAFACVYLVLQGRDTGKAPMDPVRGCIDTALLKIFHATLSFYPTVYHADWRITGYIQERKRERERERTGEGV